jgi:hypothetical protein
MRSESNFFFNSYKLHRMSTYYYIYGYCTTAILNKPERKPGLLERFSFLHCALRVSVRKGRGETARCGIGQSCMLKIGLSMPVPCKHAFPKRILMGFRDLDDIALAVDILILAGTVHVTDGLKRCQLVFQLYNFSFCYLTYDVKRFNL